MVFLYERISSEAKRDEAFQEAALIFDKENPDDTIEDYMRKFVQNGINAKTVALKVEEK